jgi:hypothetical protein
MEAVDSTAKRIHTAVTHMVETHTAVTRMVETHTAATHTVAAAEDDTWLVPRRMVETWAVDMDSNTVAVGSPGRALVHPMVVVVEEHAVLQSGVTFSSEESCKS